jgi:S1-C subfamily serine protease
MKPVVAVVLALLLLAPVNTLASDWTAIAETLKKSVVEITYDGDGTCTGFLINANLNLFASVGHCDTGDPNKRVYVNQVPATVVAKDVKNDLMVLKAPGVGDGMVALSLADKNPVDGEEFASRGFGMGLNQSLFRTGHISANAVQLDGFDGTFVAIDGAFVPGQSGGPGVNRAGELVCVVRLTSDRVGLCIPAETVKDKIGRFFAKSTARP